MLGRFGRWLVHSPQPPLSRIDSAWLLGIVLIRAAMAVAIVYLGLRLAVYGHVDWHVPVGILVMIAGLVTGLVAVLRLRIWMRFRSMESPNS